MLKGLLVVERMVLESLSNGPKGLSDVHFETGLNLILIGNIVDSLLERRLVLEASGGFTVDKHANKDVIKMMNDTDALSAEVKELFISFINHYFSSERDAYLNIPQHLRLRKVWLDHSEEKVLQGHLNNLETFISNIEKNQKKNPPALRLGEKKIIFWGHSGYGPVVQQSIKRA